VRGGHQLAEVAVTVYITAFSARFMLRRGHTGW